MTDPTPEELEPTVRVEIADLIPVEDREGAHELRHNGRLVATYPSAEEARKAKATHFGDSEEATIEPQRPWSVSSEKGLHETFHTAEDANEFVIATEERRQGLTSAGCDTKHIAVNLRVHET